MSYSYRLRDGNINPKEVLKNQINFKSDLGEIKKKMQTRKSNKCNTKCWNFFDLREKIIDF